MRRPSFTQLFAPRQPGAQDRAPDGGGDYRPVASLTARAALGLLGDALLILPLFGLLRLAVDVVGVEASDGWLAWAAAAVYLGVTCGRGGSRRGQTIGKQLAGMRVVRASDGGPIGVARAWGRGGVAALLVPWAFPLGALAHDVAGARAIDGGLSAAVSAAVLGMTALFGGLSRRRRTPHDLLLGTTVCRTSITRTPSGIEHRDPPRGLPAAVPLGRRARDATDLLPAAAFVLSRLLAVADHLR